MNDGLHFLTGYLISMIFIISIEKMNQKPLGTRNFLLFFGGFAGMIPDLLEYPIFGLGHGTWTHTILFGSLLSIIMTSIIYILAYPQFNSDSLSYGKILVISWIATMSHLIVDIFTHTKFNCIEAELDLRHIYFWPIWDQSFHMDCLFGWSYTARILIEWAIYLPIILGILIWRFRKYQENPLKVLNPKVWWAVQENDKKNQTKLNLVPIFLFVPIIIYLILLII